MFDTFLKTFAKDSVHFNISNLMFLLGVGGAGKTTVLFKTILAMLKKDNPNLSVWLSAPAEGQVQKLYDDLFKETPGLKTGNSVESFSKIDLFKTLNKELPTFIEAVHKDLNLETKKYTEIEVKNGYFNIGFTEEFNTELLNFIESLDSKKLPNIIFIDENSHYSIVEYLILSKLREKFGTTIITAGDPNQRGKNLNITYNSDGTKRSQEIGFNIDYVYGFTNIRLLSSIRSLNSLVKSNTDRAFTLQRTVKEILHGIIKGDVDSYINKAKEVGILELAYEATDNKLNGHIITNDLETYLKKIPKDGTIGILTKDGKLEDSIDALLLTLGLKDRIKVFSLDNLQGNETDYFIFDAELLGKNIDFDSYYTFITRAKKGTIILDKDSILENAGFTNVSKKSYEITPLTKDLIDEATNKRKSILDKLNKGVDGTIP